MTLAVSANAVLVTGDIGLARVSPQPPMQILMPSEFLREFDL